MSEQEHKVTIIINQHSYHFERTTLAPQDFRDAVSAPPEYEVWKIVKSPDPEGQLPDDDIQITGPVEVKNGDRFRVVPPGTFGQTPLPAKLVEEVKGLQLDGLQADLIAADGFANVVLHGYPVPAGYTKSTTELLLKLPLSYPNGRPDMFWTDVDLLLVGGGAPRSAEHIEQGLGKQWRRFSWHPQAWNPAVDDLRTYLEFVNGRLAKVQ